MVRTKRTIIIRIRTHVEGYVHVVSIKIQK
jgi:hypothetical protein